MKTKKGSGSAAARAAPKAMNAMKGKKADVLYIFRYENLASPERRGTKRQIPSSSGNTCRKDNKSTNKNKRFQIIVLVIIIE